MKILAVIILSIFTCTTFASRYPSAHHPVHVRTYVKHNGQLVQQHWRAKPGHRY